MDALGLVVRSHGSPVVHFLYVSKSRHRVPCLKHAGADITEQARVFVIAAGLKPQSRFFVRPGQLCRSVFYDQATPDISECSHDLTDMGVAVRVEQLADGRVIQV